MPTSVFLVWLPPDWAYGGLDVWSGQLRSWVSARNILTAWGELVVPLHDYTESHGISEKEVDQFFGEQIAERRRESKRSDEGGRTS